MRKPDAILIAAVALLAYLAMWLDHAFFANPDSYGQLQAPSYAAHGFLFAAYLLAIGLRAPVAKWKTLALAAAGASFGLWSRPVVALALAMSERDDALGAAYRAVDDWNGAFGSGALITGVTLSGVLMSAVLAGYTKSPRIAGAVLGATAIAALLALVGWSRALGDAMALALIDASGIAWHTAVAAALAAWRSQKTAPPAAPPAADAG